LYRRSLYTIWKRSSPPPAMLNFDATDRSYCAVRRQKTASPLQALVLMNDPQFVEVARILAEKVVLIPPFPTESGFRTSTVSEQKDTTSERLVYAFQAFTSRKPRQAELDILKGLLAKELAFFKENKEKAADLWDMASINARAH
jgi:hypothetical protein